jgi:dolichol-phosphate mannosyltransferase
LKNILSIIIPAFNEAEIIENAIFEICKVVATLTPHYEVIIIDDGSNDDTWKKVQAIALSNRCVKGLRFSRNFGKEQAIVAGLDCANGQAVVLMDADLQHPPQIIRSMYELWCAGDVDLVRAIKTDRGQESYVYKVSSDLFYRMLKALSGLDLKNASDFVLLDQKVVQALRSFTEATPFFRGLLAWVGFRQATVPFEVSARIGGVTKWRRSDLIGYAISNFLAFSSLPLRMVNYLAVVFFLFALVLGTFSIYRYWNNQSVEGFTTVIILLLVIGSCIMVGFGIIGEYISKIHAQTKFRPRYLTMDNIGLELGQSLENVPLNSHLD